MRLGFVRRKRWVTTAISSKLSDQQESHQTRSDRSNIFHETMRLWKEPSYFAITGPTLLLDLHTHIEIRSKSRTGSPWRQTQRRKTKWHPLSKSSKNAFVNFPSLCLWIGGVRVQSILNWFSVKYILSGWKQAHDGRQLVDEPTHIWTRLGRMI